MRGFRLLNARWKMRILSLVQILFVVVGLQQIVRADEGVHYSTDPVLRALQQDLIKTEHRLRRAERGVLGYPVAERLAGLDGTTRHYLLNLDYQQWRGAQDFFNTLANLYKANKISADNVRMLRELAQHDNFSFSSGISPTSFGPFLSRALRDRTTDASQDDRSAFGLITEHRQRLARESRDPVRLSLSDGMGHYREMAVLHARRADESAEASDDIADTFDTPIEDKERDAVRRLRYAMDHLAGIDWLASQNKLSAGQIQFLAKLTDVVQEEDMGFSSLSGHDAVLEHVRMFLQYRESVRSDLRDRAPRSDSYFGKVRRSLAQAKAPRPLLNLRMNRLGPIDFAGPASAAVRRDLWLYRFHMKATPHLAIRSAGSRVSP